MYGVTTKLLDLSSSAISDSKALAASSGSKRNPTGRKDKKKHLQDNSKSKSNSDTVIGYTFCKKRKKYGWENHHYKGAPTLPK